MSDTLPTLDVSRLVEQGAHALEDDFLAALDRACREWGLFLVTGHGIPAPRLADFDRELRGFFALPTAAKQGVARSAENPWGYYDRELTKNVPDWKEIFDFGPERSADAGRNQWPPGHPRFRAAVRAHYADCTRLAESLLDAISRALGLPATALRAPFRGHSSFLRLNHYPPCEQPASDAADLEPVGGALGVNRHTDAGALTVLYQDDVASLQVRQGEHWVTVPTRSDALVVNLGDMLQVWSNDLYAAPLHRVLARRDRARVSAPFFYNPAPEVRVEPLATPRRGDQPSRYRAVPWAEFRARRAAGDYADLGAEVQLDDYRAASAVTDRPA